MRAPVVLLAISFAGPLLIPPASAASAATPQLRRWVEHADVDGDGTPDRIVITAGKDLRIDQSTGFGHYTIQVHLSSTGATVSKRLDADGYDNLPAKRWTPWFGAADIDHVGGQEILLGEQSGASSSQFYVLVYTRGRLRSLPGPGGQTWDVNSDADESNGFRCTADGIEARGYGQVGPGFSHWVVDRDWYVWRNNRWRHTKHIERHVHRASQPPGTRSFGGFQCAGLPADQI
jgi:hypothetical protein